MTTKRKKIIILNATYFILEFFLAIFAWGAGHGSLIPITALLGIFSIPVMLDYSLNLGYLLLLASIQFFLYCLTLEFLSRTNFRKFFKILPISHYFGAIIAFLIFEKKIPRLEHVMLFLFIAIVVSFYWKKCYSILYNKEK